MSCHPNTNNEGGDGIQWHVHSFVNDPTRARDMVLRAALVNFCSTGINPIHCGKATTTDDFFSYGIGDPEYAQVLRDHADAFPGIDTDVSFESNQVSGVVELHFDWNVQSMSDIATGENRASSNNSENTTSLVTFAMMHQFDLIQEPLVMNDVRRFCVTSLVGPVCLYEGSAWRLRYDIPPISFRAPRPLSVWSLPMIAESLRQDLHFRLPEFYQHGIGDTYFSGKMLAKLARILLVWEEVDEICNPMTPFFSQAYITTCRGIQIPSRDVFEEALFALKSSVEIWLNGTAVTPFVYDPAWGGVASCGCAFDSDTQGCRNQFPNCDGFEDPGLNFGNAFYNDMHFHYGYFIMASAVVAHFDPEWGIATYEQVLLLIRCIANPSEEDVYFPTWRFKDFYRGNSWANGIATIYLNGKNQESSSEAIAAYEAIALYGETMVSFCRLFEPIR
jgi:endoglucanase Acf2